MNWCEYPGWFLGSEVLQNYGCRMASGLWITVELVIFSVLLGFAMAFGLAVARLYGPRWAARLVSGYTTFFRGTPLLCQLFLVYYGLGQFRVFWQDIGLWWFFRDPFYCALLTFTINTAAYQAEILRGAIQSIPRGQFEGALSLGLHRWATLRLVVMPQAMILALRPLGNELIVMIKASAIASLVTLFDLMGATRLAFARSFDLSIYLYAALIYLVFVEIIRRVWDRLEIRLSRHMALR
ncbi:ABC transporter permease subunit [Bosea sp. F3-2]|uniref:ABC transporter permease n=1 Tax=Bosea sp. F3-2 TaxID=2599640 RepID=UPI0011EBD721|nr:ABC transporter permease subunit [Bosea sp. F3-2]QEL22812.1 ABC transporter permease subunit [Bosea sp. F3-2]